MKKTNQKALYMTVIASAILLSACGGGGGTGSSGSIGGGSTGGTGSTPTSLTLLSGNSMVIPGTVSTETSLLKTLKWTVSAQTPSAGALVLSNDSCGVVTKNDQIFVPVPGSPPSAKTGSSTWKCDLGVVAPKGVTADTSYKILLTSTDDKGNTSTTENMLIVKPNPSASTGAGSSGAGVTAGSDFAVTAGAKAPLVCSGPATSSYQWVVTDNGGLPITLSSYTGAAVDFTAPSVSAATKIVATCRATDVDSNVTTSSVTVTVNPATVDLTLNTAIAKGLVGTPGQSIDITGTASWYDIAGKATTGPVIAYNWTLGAGVPTGVTLLSNGGPTTQLYVNPGVLTAPANIPVTLNATSGGKTSQTTVSVLVDPFGPLTPAVDTPAQVVKSGVAIKDITANTKTGLYYQWTQVSGVPVILGGASTAKVSFVAPTVAANSDVILRVAMAYSPITPSNPGVYFVDAVVQVQP